MEIIIRKVNSTDWITIVIFLCVLLLATAKLVNTAKFSDFIMLFNINKYIILPQKGSKISTIFNGILMLVQTLSASLLIYLCFDIMQWQKGSIDSKLYFKISTLYLLILVCKTLIEKIIATIFSIEAIIEHYLFHKISYRNFLGVILLPLHLFFYYNLKPSVIVLSVILILLIILNLIILFSIYKKNEKVILNNLFYFILYLCALETAPFFIVYKLII